ncbi:hypothetical protein GmHk_18G052522 [Glycine max]|nr:hypothetical protein GmHk_18G052522 [Glycine max]
METEQHPPQQSPLIDVGMHDERLQPHAQSYEFIASREDFMSNLMGIDLQALEYAYAYIQSMPIPSFASFHQSISASALVYRDADIIPSDEGIMFQSLSDPKVITISDDMLLATLRNTIFTPTEVV